MENRSLVKFIQNYVWGSSGIVSISSLVRITFTLLCYTVACAKIPLSMQKKRKLHSGVKIWILFLSGRKQYFTHLLCSFVKYCFYHLKMKFISSCHHVISSMCYIGHSIYYLDITWIIRQCISKILKSLWSLAQLKNTKQKDIDLSLKNESMKWQKWAPDYLHLPEGKEVQVWSLGQDFLVRICRQCKNMMTKNQMSQALKSCSKKSSVKNYTKWVCIFQVYYRIW